MVVVLCEERAETLRGEREPSPVMRGSMLTIPQYSLELSLSRKRCRQRRQGSPATSA